MFFLTHNVQARSTAQEQFVATLFTTRQNGTNAADSSTKLLNYDKQNILNDTSSSVGS